MVKFSIIKKHVLLLKDPPDDPADAYSLAFIFESYSARYVSPLSTVPPPPEVWDAFKAIVAAGAEGKYSGVIVTSKRAVAAWKTAVEELEAQAAHDKGKGKGKEVIGEGWDKVPFFAVGHATADALRAVPGPGDQLVIGGESSGNGALLALLILSHFSSSHDPSLPCLADVDADRFLSIFRSHRPSFPPELPLLYLTGDKRSPALPEILASADPPIPILEHQVYGTSPSSSVASEVSKLLDDFSSGAWDVNLRPGEPKHSLDWVVLFSPSGGKTALPTLRDRGVLQEDGDGKRLKVAAIGPTTAAWLRGEGIEPDAVAEKPEAAALVRAIVEADKG